MVCVLRNSSEFLFFVGEYQELEFSTLGNTVANGFSDLPIGWQQIPAGEFFLKRFFSLEKMN